MFAKERSSSSPEHTLEVMRQRLRRAEGKTRKLAENLAEYGFNTNPSEGKQEETKTGWIEPVTPFRPTVIQSAEKELLERNRSEERV